MGHERRGGAWKELPTANIQANLAGSWGQAGGEDVWAGWEWGGPVRLIIAA